jgi:Rne/Rng family ribonuclease
MKREILISATQREVRVAILEDDQLVEMAVERPEARRMIGDIYWGKVDAVLPGLQAAFVDIGTEKSAFLHASDLVYDEGDDDDDDDDDAGPSDPDPEQPESLEAASQSESDSLRLPNEGASAREGGRGRRRGGRGRGRRGGKPVDPNAPVVEGAAPLDGAGGPDNEGPDDSELPDIASLAPDDDSPYAPSPSESPSEATAIVPYLEAPLPATTDSQRMDPIAAEAPRLASPRPQREPREPKAQKAEQLERTEKSEKSEKTEKPEKSGHRGGGRRARKEPPQIQDVLKRGQSIIVQVSKEPISTKGPRVTAQVSLAGRFVVYMPFASRVGVSRKIGERAERQRLREQVQKVLPKNSGGVIVRTSRRRRSSARSRRSSRSGRVSTRKRSSSVRRRSYSTARRR